MKNGHAPEIRNTRRILSIACATALAAAFAASLPQPARAGRVTPPPVPASIQVPAGNTAFLVGHAVGTQNYVCLPSATSITGFAWTLFTPEATLFNDDDKQLITHFFSPNPDPLDPNTNPAVVADGAIRATWQHSRDTSTVWAKLHVAPYTDADFVAPGAVAWLLLERVGDEAGPDGGDVLTATTFIHRLNTAGGLAPSTGCAVASNIGNQAFVPYAADYFFYRGPDSGGDDAN